MGVAGASSPVRRATRKGVLSLVAGFGAGVTVFAAMGAGPADAVFSALSLAFVVTLRRLLAG